VDAAPDGYPWTRQQTATPTRDTGPDKDHTGAGAFLYTEASGRNGKIHRLESPLFSLQHDSTLSFFYHMYGADMGTLSVEAHEDGSGWSTLWSRIGDQDNLWRKADVVLPATTTMVRINGETGDGLLSDMAIDDMKASA